MSLWNPEMGVDDAEKCWKGAALAAAEKGAKLALKESPECVPAIEAKEKIEDILNGLEVWQAIIAVDLVRFGIVKQMEELARKQGKRWNGEAFLKVEPSPASGTT